MSIFLPTTYIPSGMSVSSYLSRPQPQAPMGSGLGMRTSAAPTSAPQPFQWGANGQMIDPLQRAPQPDFSPIDHWTQGAARMGQAYADALQRRQEQFPSVPGGGPLTLASRLGFNSGGLY